MKIKNTDFNSSFNSKRKAKLQVLQDALIKGEQSGIPIIFDFEQFIACKRASADII